MHRRRANFEKENPPNIIPPGLSSRENEEMRKREEDYWMYYDENEE